MRTKFEVWSNVKEKKGHPIYTVLLEEKENDLVEFRVLKYSPKNLTMMDSRTALERKDEPITDGIFAMSKPNMKKFVKLLKVFSE